MGDTVLILGATGRFGAAAATAFEEAGWTVRRFDRARDSLPEAAIGADVVVNGWNPPYDRWAAELPVLTERVVEAIRASGATLIQPCNVYVYGAGSGPVLGPDTPHRAENPLGRLRREMEATLAAAGPRVIFLRAGDFIDTAASGNWLDRIILKPLAKGRIDYPGDPDIPHAWAYLPDLGQAAVALAARRAALPQVTEVVHPGYTLSGRDLARLASDATGREIGVRRMTWLPLRLLAPVWPMIRGLVEMRYLWSMPHEIDGTAFRALLPDLGETPPGEAMARQIAGLSSR